MSIKGRNSLEPAREMPTIAKTKQYHQLVYRHLKLVRLYTVMSELNLHINRAVDKDIAEYYWNVLFNMGVSPDFFGVSLESMRQVFYIELNGFIGAYWNKEVKCRDNDSGSLAKYLYDGKRKRRKKTAQSKFEELLRDHEEALISVWNLRGDLSHFVDLNKRNANLLPSDLNIRKVLNDLAEVLWLLGYQPNNTPHYIDENSGITRDVQGLIDKLIYGRDKVNKRKKYLKSREAWFKQPAK